MPPPPVKFSTAPWAAAKLMAVLFLLLGALWFFVPADPKIQTGAFLGWVGLLFVGMTLCGILWGSASTRVSTVVVGWAFMGLCASAFLHLVALSGHLLGMTEALRTSALLLGWMALWMAASFAMRPCGPGVSVGLALLLAMVFVAMPMAGVPLARDAGSHQGSVVQAIGVMCPLLGALDGMRPAIQVNWPTLPGMYRMSGLGQDIPMELPRWWVDAGVYLGMGALVLGLRWLHSLRGL